MAAKLVLTGFKTQEEVEAFLAWYCNSGEQELGQDLECRREEGSNVPLFMGMDSPEQVIEDDNGDVVVIQELKMTYDWGD